MHRVDIYPTDVGTPLITEPSALTLQQALHLFFGQLAVFYQGAFLLRELLTTDRAVVQYA